MTPIMLAAGRKVPEGYAVVAESKGIRLVLPERMAKNCGTGSGGFQEGNTCARGGSFPGEITDNVTAMYSGQVNGTLSAKIGGRVAGHLDWQSYQDGIQIAYVETAEDARGKGVATALLDRLKADNPGQWIEWGMMTPDGAKLREAYDRKNGTFGGGNVSVDKAGNLVTPVGALIHGTTADAAEVIGKEGLKPRVGAFVESAYADEIKAGVVPEPVVFLTDSSEHGGPRSAITEHVARKLGKDFDKVTAADVAKHGALVVARESKVHSRLYRYDADTDDIYERGTVEGRRVTGMMEKPLGVEDGDVFAFDEVPTEAAVTGEALARWWRAGRVGKSDNCGTGAGGFQAGNTCGQARAKGGGEWGPNGEWYNGGAFIATKDIPKMVREKIERAARAAGDAVPVGPGTWEVPPVGKFPIWAHVGAYLDSSGKVNEQYVRYQQNQGMSDQEISQVRDLGRRLAAGEHWGNMNDHPDFVPLGTLARAMKEGHVVPGAVVSRLRELRPDLAEWFKRVSSNQGKER